MASHRRLETIIEEPHTMSDKLSEKRNTSVQGQHSDANSHRSEGQDARQSMAKQLPCELDENGTGFEGVLYCMDATLLRDFALIQSTFRRAAGHLDIPIEDVFSCFNTFRLDTEAEEDEFRLYEKFYTVNIEEESMRVPSTIMNDNNPDPEHVFSCWKQFKIVYPVTWPSILKLQEKICNIPRSRNLPEDRKRMLGYFIQQLASSMEQLDKLAESHGLHSVLIVAGNDIVRDDGVGMAYESSQSLEFLGKLTRSSTDEAVEHLKAHVWHNHSTALLAQEFDSQTVRDE
ncbi:uncharacterized protein LAESUDRAFT_718686, partial [Laetiporus sulphureus 93-53]